MRAGLSPNFNTLRGMKINKRNFENYVSAQKLLDYGTRNLKTKLPAFIVNRKAALSPSITLAIKITS